MLVTGKREWLARTIVRSCHWLSTRSVRFQLLFEDIGGSLFLNDKMRLPAADPRYDAADLGRRTDEFNVAAEDYFARNDGRDFLLGKPFTERLLFARRLFDLGVLFHWLRLTPGDVVLEIGAGSCWLSHLLNRFGCTTLSVDVSATALEIGRELFESDPRTNWTVGPEFIVYDGHRLPLEDDSVDKVVIYDAFHHIPNEAAVLREVARVLRDGGIVGMREPGRRHAAAEKSLAEVREFGVLENDIVVEDIERLGRRCGLDRTTVVPLTLDASIEIPASELAEFMRGKHLHAYWEGLCTAMVDGTFVLMYKGEALPDTRRPRRLAARIAPKPQADPVCVRLGETRHLDVEIENTGDTLWLADTPGLPGWTRLGIRLHAADDTSTLIDGEWHRVVLPHDVAPDDVVTVDVDLPPVDRPGDYLMVFDLVAEEVAWFADVDSPTTTLRLQVLSTES